MTTISSTTVTLTVIDSCTTGWLAAYRCALLAFAQLLKLQAAMQSLQALRRPKEANPENAKKNDSSGLAPSHNDKAISG